eukprot:gnl/TRDRNA2_/TRDRNA2_177517_c0_seq12.p1 gnl/TRDRNA2_/TRDRNA2_177517_c0~~gnl/TRDRNA2_/TRDRNA2_177517_c0_seq12.p1  ORF type:complete len:362 (-),score=49.85 gnl/TRDRNA2_/TRDRNA2_177517_c0_seq12:279-1265(-)
MAMFVPQVVMMPQGYGMGRPPPPTPYAKQFLGTNSLNQVQLSPRSSLPRVASSGAITALSQPAGKCQDKSMIRSNSLTSLSTADCSRGPESSRGSFGSRSHASSSDSTDDSLAHQTHACFEKFRTPSSQWVHVPSLDASDMERQRTARAQEKTRRWVSKAMSERIRSLEKELASQKDFEERNKKEKDTLDRQRSQAQLMRLQKMEERHQRQHDVYDEAQRIAVEKQHKAAEKAERWDEQVCTVLCERQRNHQIRKDMQQAASHAMESLNEKIREQQVHSKINTAELRDHMTKCLNHELFNREHLAESMAKSPRAPHSPRSYGYAPTRH